MSVINHSRLKLCILVFIFGTCILLLYILDYIKLNLKNETNIYHKINQQQKLDHSIDTKDQSDFASNSQGLRICSQDERKNNIKYICNKYTKLRDRTKIIFEVDEKHKLAYCRVSKAGGSTWRVIMANLSSAGKVVIGQHPGVWGPYWSHTFANHYGVKRVAYSKTQLAVQALKTYTKFVVIRHPLIRLISAFYDKVKYSNYIKKLKLVENYRNFTYNNTIEYRKKLPTFSEFVTMVVNDTDETAHDLHWAKQEDVCDICNVDYQYIIKLETLESDVSMLMNNEYLPQLNKHEKQIMDNKWYTNIRLRYKPERQVRPHLNEFKEYNNLHNTLFDKVQQKFSYGMDLLGYSFNKNNLTAKCESSYTNCC